MTHTPIRHCDYCGREIYQDATQTLILSLVQCNQNVPMRSDNSYEWLIPKDICLPCAKQTMIGLGMELVSEGKNFFLRKYVAPVQDMTPLRESALVHKKRRKKPSRLTVVRTKKRKKKSTARRARQR